MGSQPAKLFCGRCGVSVTSDNIGITLEADLHYCKDCVKREDWDTLKPTDDNKKFLCPDCGHVHGNER